MVNYNDTNAVKIVFEDTYIPKEIILKYVRIPVRQYIAAVMHLASAHKENKCRALWE